MDRIGDLNKKIRLAAYLDEAADDPAAACAILAGLRLTHVCLRNVGTVNICAANSDSCREVKDALDSHGLRAVAVMSECGLHGVQDGLFQDVDRAVLLALYYGAQYVRCYAPPTTYAGWWYAGVAERCGAAGLTPLLEIGDDSAMFGHADLAVFFRAHPGWKWLYDPATLLRRLPPPPADLGHEDALLRSPFVTHWALLRHYVAALDLRDFSPVDGTRPVGHGAAGWSMLFQDLHPNPHPLWGFIEHGLGRNYGSGLTKADSLTMALEAIAALATPGQEE